VTTKRRLQHPHGAVAQLHRALGLSISLCLHRIEFTHGASTLLVRHDVFAFAFKRETFC
jgi:hypothetical protein